MLLGFILYNHKLILCINNTVSFLSALLMVASELEGAYLVCICVNHELSMGLYYFEMNHLY